MTRRMSLESTIHDAVRVEIECPAGHSGRRWLAFNFVGADGEKTEITVWSPNDESPELVIADDVSVRRVHTIED